MGRDSAFHGSAAETSGPSRALTQTIRRIRHRWRIRQALSGIAFVGASMLAGMVVGLWLVVHFRYHPAAVITARILVYGVSALAAVRYLVLPLRRPMPDSRVALYLEEQEPSLRSLIVSAVDATGPDVASSIWSPPLVMRLIHHATERLRAAGNGNGIEARRITLSLAALAGILGAGAVLVAKSPAAVAAWHPFVSPMDRPLFITVTPGDGHATHGGDIAITARLHGFNAAAATLAVRSGDADAWDTLPMAAQDSGAFQVHLYDVQRPMTYYVEAAGIRSPTFDLGVLDRPYVKAIELTYHYPAYTKLPVTRIAPARDIGVLKGTRIEFKVATTRPVKGGRLLTDGTQAVPLALGTDGTLLGQMTAAHSGTYRIELRTLAGDLVPGSLEYVIDVFDDRPPTIAFDVPGRDTRIAADGAVTSRSSG